jgi:predicted RNA-binding protein (virulence factor B family)
VQEQVRAGFWVGDDADSAFLPIYNAPEELEVGQELEVFVFHDKDGSPMATTDDPLVQRGEFAFLEVVDVADHGAYLNWGLERDLFVPHGLQHRRMSIGDHVVVVVDVDDQGRVYASSKLAGFFDNALNALQVGAEVKLLVYGFTDLGTLVVVDGRFTGLVYKSETFQELYIGDALTGWVSGLRGDGRVDVSLQRAKKAGTLDAREVIWDALVENGGFLPLTDRSSPEAIHSALQMSKKRFKKAVGSLYKDRRIRLDDDGIRVVE